MAVVNILLLILQGLLGAAFTGSGTSKLLPGDNPSKQGYAKVRLPMWWLTPIGLTEIVAGISLFVGFFVSLFAVLGTVLAVCTMAGAVLAHVVRDKKFEGYPALVLLVLSSMVLWRHWPELVRLVGIL
jgi:uncharacterized membrane protein YphA (DoxX/SURF4 family)